MAKFKWKIETEELQEWQRGLHPLKARVMCCEIAQKAKRCTKTIEVLPHPDASGKVMYLVASEMNERYKRRLLRNWDRIDDKLQSIRMVKYDIGCCQTPVPLTSCVFG
jgi:hypothetical protein